MAKRIIIKNETIPNTGKLLGQTSIVHKLGGNTTTSFNSTDIFNFDVKDEGEIEQKDPQKSYLTTTFYPLLFTDKLDIKAKSIDRAILTDNLYATHGFSEEVSLGVSDVQIVQFKKALYVIDYYSNSYAKRDAFRVKASNIVLNLRDVLRTYAFKPENIKVGNKKVSFVIRSVLIIYSFYKPENIKTRLTNTNIATTIFSNKFSSILVGDSKNVGTVVNNDVTMIKDKGQLTWNFSNNMTVSKTARFEENALNMDKLPSYLQSNESLNITSEDGVEIFFEDWIKPATITKLLLTSYNNTTTFREKPLLMDKIDNVLWTVTGSGLNTNSVDIPLTNTLSIKKVVAKNDLLIKNPTTGSKGTTLELNCKVEGSDKIYLLSNGLTTTSETVKESFGLVWYGNETSDQTLKNRVAIYGDDPSLIDANKHMVVSTNEYPTGSELNITVIFYNMYLKLFVNGVLQGVKLINRTFDLGFGGQVCLGKVDWYAYKSTHNYLVKSLRLTDMALHLDNSFSVTDPYDLKAIPDIARLNEAVKYPLGLTCGLRYEEVSNEVFMFATITDSNNITFVTESAPIDISRWNFVQLASTASDVTLFVNGVANGSLTLPYNIKFKDILVGSKETNGYQGKMDNFRIYSKIKDVSQPLRSSELFFYQNGQVNTNLVDSNSQLVWTKNRGATINANSNSTYRGMALVGGLSTTNTEFLINPYKFENTFVLDNISYKTNADTSLISAPTLFTATSQSFTTPFNLAKDGLTVTFKATDTTDSTLIDITSAKIEIAQISDTTFKLEFVANNIRSDLEYVFQKDTQYQLTFLKLGQQVIFYVNNSKTKELTVQTNISSLNVTVGTFTGEVSKLAVSDNIVTKALVMNAVDEETQEGFLVEMYEPFEDNFIYSTYFNPLIRVVSDNIVTVGSNTVSAKFANKTLSLEVNGVETEGAKTEYRDISQVVNILEVNKTPLNYFQSISSSQDALLPVPYKIDSLLNESVYSKAVLALSSDSDYRSNIIFDRSSFKVAKDVVNTNVSKGMSKPGFYFDGTGSNLKIDSNDFAFGTEDFYIEFEVLLNSLAKRAVILDRYLNEAGSWQVSINTDGHLYFTITNSNTSPYYYFVDVPVNITTNIWTKVQVSRKGTTLKFYVNDSLVYEYDSGSIINFDKKDVPLYIGHQGTKLNAEYNLNGYLNNIRIVKGLPFELETDDESLIVEKIKEQPDHPAVTTVVEQLIGNVTWTLDSANNQIKYTQPSGSGNTNRWLFSGISGTVKDQTFLTPEEAALAWFAQQCAAGSSNYCGRTVQCPTYNGSGSTVRCGYNNLPITSTQGVTVNVTANPNYDPEAQEEKTIPLSAVASQIILNSEMGDADAKDFVGEKTLIPEQYNIYNTTSDTVFNISAKDGAFYDSKSNTWENTQYLQIEDGRAPINSQWLKLTTDLSSTVSKVIDNTSEFILESSFTLTEQLATDKELMYFGSLLRVSVAANNQGFKILFNGIEYSIKHLLRDEVWYKFALCYRNNLLTLYIDDYRYILPYVSATWSTTAASIFKLVNGTTKYEAVKLSSKCVYKLNKGRDNLYLSSHLCFEKNLVDNGNNPKTVTLTSISNTSTVKPYYGLQSASFGSESRLSIVEGMSFERKPFTLELTLLLSEQDTKEVLATFDSELTHYELYKDIDNKLKLSITFEDETITHESVGVSPVNTWFKLNLSRDLSNILSIGIDESIKYITGFSNNLVATDLVIGGFKGNIYEIKTYDNYSITSKKSLNILKLDFEKNTLTEKYVTDLSNKKLMHNNNVTLVKGLSKTSDYVGYFDGVSSYLNMQKDDFLNFEKEQFEISFSMYPTSGINNYQTIFATSSSTFLANSLYIMMYGSTQPSHITEPAINRIAVGIGPDLATNPFLLSSSLIDYNTWTNVKLVRENGFYNLYINDVLDKSVKIDLPFNLNSTSGTLIGKNIWDAERGYFQGYLDNIKVARNGSYRESTEIDATEGLISGLDFEDVGSGFDVVESELDPNLTDSYSNSWVLGRYNTASDFPYYRTVSAINDAIYFKNQGFMYCYNKHFAMGLDPFTISISFNQTKRSSSDAYLIHVYGLYALVITSSGYLEIDMAGTRTRIGLVNLETFYTFAITRDSSSTIRIFLDGKLMSTQVNKNFNANFGTGTIYPLCLGTRFDTRTSSNYVSNYYIGYLDNFIFDRDKCRYDKDYAVFMDKSEKIKNSSFVEFKEDSITSFPDLAVPSLVWTASGITTTATANKYTTFSGQNLLNSGYMNSTVHGWQLGYEDFSLDIIFKPRQTTAETCLVDLSLNTGITEGLRVLQHNSSTASITVEIGSTGSASWSLSLNTGVNSLAIGNVYHLRVTRNLGTIYLYLNGVLKDSASFTGDINIGSTISLFNNRARTRGFTGTIEQFRFIKNSAVSALESFTEIKESLK